MLQVALSKVDKRYNLIEVDSFGNVKFDYGNLSPSVTEAKQTGNYIIVPGTIVLGTSVTNAQGSPATRLQGPTSTDGDLGGYIDLSDGSVAGGTPWAGSVLIAGNNAGAGTNKYGGFIDVFAGNGNGTGVGGEVNIRAGDSGAGATGSGGPVYITGGASLSTNGAGGLVQVGTGLGTGTGAGGVFSVTTGLGGIDAAGGAFTLITGNAGGGNRAGGAITITLGDGTGTGSGGTFNLIGGISGDGATGSGSSLNFTAGSSNAINGNGGNINHTPGNETGTGTKGEFRIRANAHLELSASEWLVGTVDKVFFIATRAVRVKAITARVTVAEGSARTATIRKVPSGTAITSGTALHTGSVNLNGTANTNQALTLSATPADLELASGDSLATDFDGAIGTGTGALTVGLALM